MAVLKLAQPIFKEEKLSFLKKENVLSFSFDVTH